MSDTKAPNPSPARTVLLVEDDARFVHAIQYYLQKHGYRVLVARNGVEGFETYLEERPDLLVTDNALPRMMGFELVARVRQTEGGDRLPIVLISAFDQPSGLDDGETDLTDAFLAKPFALSELLRTLRDLLAEGDDGESDRVTRRVTDVGRWRTASRQTAARRTPLPTAAERAELLSTEMDRASTWIREHGIPGPERLPAPPAAPDPMAEDSGAHPAPPLAAPTPEAAPSPAPDSEQSALRVATPTPESSGLPRPPSPNPLPRLAAPAGGSLGSLRRTSTDAFLAGMAGGPSLMAILPPPAGVLPERIRLENLAPASLLGRALAQRATGIARVRGPASGFTAVLREGIPCYVETAAVEDSFGAYLRDRGVVSEPSYARYAASWQQGRRPPPARFLHEDNLAADDLLEQLSRFVGLRIGEFLALREGAFAFRSDGGVLTRWPPLLFDPVALVIEHLGGSASDEALRSRVEPLLGRRIVLADWYEDALPHSPELLGWPGRPPVGLPGPEVGAFLRNHAGGVHAAAVLLMALLQLELVRCEG